MSWTNDKVKLLKELIIEKKSLKQMGEILGFTRNAVAGKCHRLGLAVNSGIRCGRKGMQKYRPTLKSDRAVLVQIKKHTDSWGWGLEFDEIVEYTGFSSLIVLQSVKSLLSSGHINRIKSNIADHLFFNDDAISQRGRCW